MITKTKTIQLFFFTLIFFDCFAFAESASADYYAQGINFGFRRISCIDNLII